MIKFLGNEKLRYVCTFIARSTKNLLILNLIYFVINGDKVVLSKLMGQFNVTYEG